jgi:hypothetical protein
MVIRPMRIKLKELARVCSLVYPSPCPLQG